MPPRAAASRVYYEMLREAALAHTTEEWMELGQQHRIPIMRANTLDEVLEDPHLKAVNFFQTARTPERRALSRHAPAGEVFENARHASAAIRRGRARTATRSAEFRSRPP